jgi:hypothetical protein
MPLLEESFMRLNEFEMLPEGAFRPRAGGGMTLHGKGGGSAPSADPNIGIAQREMSALSKEQWDMFTTDIYPEMLKQSQTQEARAQSQYDLTSEITRKQQGYADMDRARYEQGAIPAMERLKADADLYNTEGEQERLAGLAMGDIKSAADVARQQTEMRQRSYGIDPTSGVAAGNANANQIMLAGAQASAANQTRQAAKDLGLQKQANVYNMYAGLPAQSNASTGIALGSSAQGFAGGQAAFGNYGAMGGSLNAATDTSSRGWQGVGQLGVSKYGADVSAYNAEQQAGGAMASGLGSAVGSAAALY